MNDNQLNIVVLGDDELASELAAEIWVSWPRSLLPS